MRRLAPWAALAPVLVLAGCGGGPPVADLFVVERSGTVPGARLTLRVTDDGGGHCNGGPRVGITSEQLLEARELRRELDGSERDEEERGLAEDGLSLPPGPTSLPSIFSYRVRSKEGTIRFSDTSRGPGDVLPRIVKLTRDVARGPCGLAR